MNKCDDANKLDLNTYRLQKDFPQIKGFYQTSCLEGTGIEELGAAIHAEIPEIEHVYNVVLASFLHAKAELETATESKDILDVSEYREICARHEIGEAADQDLLLRFLHELGVVLHFDDPDSPYRLKETKILNPRWVTNGVYKVLNDETAANEGGVLGLADLGRILTEEDGYPERGRHFILGMMDKFELGFQLADGTHRYLVPELLPETEPALDLETEDALRFEYHYEFLPEGVVPRFIVRMHAHLDESSELWRSGLLIRIDGNRVMVRSDAQSGRVYISVLMRRQIGGGRSRPCGRRFSRFTGRSRGISARR